MNPIRKLFAVFLFSLPVVAAAMSSTGEREPPAKSSAWDHVPKPSPRTDHTTFFKEPFPDGPAVTRACLECHVESAAEVMKTAHWNWQGEEVMVPGHEEPMRIGKRNVINNFCIGIKSNWPACTSCHIGYGWEDENFDFNDPTRVDCLACHDNSGTYLKKSQGAGLPDESVDLLVAARSVGRPTRKNCGACHFQGGGANAVKHGDLDNTLLFPSAGIDVHMGKNKMSCVDCHRSKEHLLPGRAMSVSVDATNRLRCTDCHAAKPHAHVRLNAHTERLACQACHVPFMAVEEPTKMTWDWSEAGQDLGITDEHLYLKIKGRFTYAKGVRPEYYWYNEYSTRYILGDKMDPSVPTRLTAPLGDREDPTAKIWPFKVHRGVQIYDKVYKYFILPNVHGPEGFWTKFDWQTAARLGSEVTGLEFSGVYDFAPTEMFWPLSHMVAGNDKALQCRDCHGERGQLDWQALGYPKDPIGPESFEHMPIPLMDGDGAPVASSGKPLSTKSSCGMCHDVTSEGFVAKHYYHTSIDAGALPEERSLLMSHGPRVPGESGEQMNCFLCHIENPNHALRLRALRSENPEWSVAASLVGTGLVSQADTGFAWNPEAFEDGIQARLGMRPVSETNCGACHGMFHDGSTPLKVSLGSGDFWVTEKTGQVFSPQRLRLSAMNLEGKDAKPQAWDVHVERLVSCGDCHYSKGRPERLAGDVKAEDLEHIPGVRRRCESCHSLEGTHLWLPEKKRHLRSVACESCHVPELHMAAQEQVDGTVMLLDGGPQIHYRGILHGSIRKGTKAYIRGYRPLLRVGKAYAEGDNKVLPYNLVSEWYWVDAGSGERVPDEQLRQAWLLGDAYRPDILQALDANQDGALDDGELRLDAEAKVFLIRENLREAGVKKPEIKGEVRAYHIHHNVTHGHLTSRDCMACHPQGEGDLRSFAVAAYAPARVKPTLIDTGQLILDGDWSIAVEDGSLLFVPARGAAESFQAHQEDQTHHDDGE